ncbi:MAG: class I SAM-dependent methyltransferase [Patescibacteria group bacterium]|nr:class I SAM-dependent methyltransferase [Patescibacteria group bacterium]
MNTETIRTGRLYGDLAYLLPIISFPEEYAEEAGHWRTVLREKIGIGRHRILELGVGGGCNLSHLTTDFEATAVDISEVMLAQCKQLNPGVELHQGDMRSIRLGRKYAAVLIHDAISYMLSENDLHSTFVTAASHLNPGGIFITSPENFSDNFQEPRIEHFTRSRNNIELTFIEYTYDPDPKDTRIETIMFYLIKEQGELRIELDRHVTGLFPKSTWIRLMTEAGFLVEERSYYLSTVNQPYNLLVGVLQNPA